MNAIRGVIFDCDVVLFESRQANLAYYNTVLEQFGIPPVTAADRKRAHVCHTAASPRVFEILLGPDRAEETIRMALAKGADRAIRVWDDAIAEAGLLDVGAKTRLLAAVVEAESPDLVLTGVQAGDDAFGATGVSLAEAVGFEWAAVVTSLDLDDDADVAHLRRELEGGVEELNDVELPAVLTIQTGINEPRYASLRGIRQAQSKEIDLRGLEDLGLDAAAVEGTVELTDVYEPESESDTQLFGGGPEEQAAALADTLRELGVGAE